MALPFKWAHGRYIEYVEDIFCAQDNGKPIQIEDHLKTTIANTIEKYALSDSEIAATKSVITSIHSVPVSYGDRTDSFHKRILLFMPLFFNCENESDERLAKFTKFGSSRSKDNVPLDPNNPTVREFKSLHILSEEAKQFSIARELERCNTGYQTQDTLFGFFVLLSNYFVARGFNNKFNLFKQKLHMRMANYILTSCLHALFFLQAYVTLSVSREVEIDEKIARVSEAWAKGGAELYAKERARNLCLKTLDPKTFKSTFNNKGDLKLPLLTKNLSYSDRIDRCEKITALHHAGLN